MLRRIFQLFPQQSFGINRQINALKPIEIHHSSIVLNNKKIDYSRVPVLKEIDLEEQFVRGSGPGGQSVNKTSNCVVLRHIPTGIIIKCHHHRLLQKNQKLARQLLITRLDDKLNGENSVENQMKRLQEKKSSDSTRKRKKLDELKAQWKERENID